MSSWSLRDECQVETHLEKTFPTLFRHRMETAIAPTMVEQPGIVEPGDFTIVPFDDDFASLFVMGCSRKRLNLG